MLPQSFCTRCDRASECEWGIRNWRCPYCGGAPRSRNDRATVEALCRQWAALSFPEVNRKLHQYGAAHIAARIGTIDDLESIATMALLRAARCFDQTRGFAFSTYAVCLIRRDLHDAMQLPVGFFRARTISARDRRDAGPDFHDKRAVDPLDELIRREEAEAVRAALRRLPARNADAVRLRFFDGASLREIAGEMNASIQCTHSRINSGLAKMTDELEAA